MCWLSSRLAMITALKSFSIDASTFESILRASFSTPSGRTPISLETTNPLAELLASCSAWSFSSWLFTSPLSVTSCLSLSTSTFTSLYPALSRDFETWSLTSGVLARCSVQPMLKASKSDPATAKIRFIRKSPPIDLPGAKSFDALLLTQEGWDDRVIGRSGNGLSSRRSRRDSCAAHNASCGVKYRHRRGEPAKRRHV